MDGNTGGAAGPRPVSPAQRRLWTLEQLRPGSPDYLLPMVVRVRGPLDAAALDAAFGRVVGRHEVLRSAYRLVDGELTQRVLDVRGPLLARVDLSGTPAEGRDAAVAELLRRELRTPVDLAAAPVLRPVLVRLAAAEHLLVVVVHHIAFDGWSWDVLCRELSAVYAELTGGAPADLAPLRTQYADHVARQPSGERLARQLAYWQDRLAGLAPLPLPTDRPRPASWDGSGDVVRFTLPAELVAAVDRVARAGRATRFMLLLAVFQSLLSRYAGQPDVAVGTPVGLRAGADDERLIGMFANTVVLRTDLSGAPSLTELLRRVRSVVLDGLSHAAAPFDRVVEALAADRDPSRTPLYQASFSLHNAVTRPLALPGTSVELLRPPLTGTPTDLVLDLNLRADGSLLARFQFATALFDRRTVQRLADAYVTLLRRALADPDEPLRAVDLLSAPDRRTLVEDYNDTAAAVPDACLHELVADRAARAPDAVALRAAGRTVSYGELDRWANAFAHRLRDAGAGPETLVGVALPRGPELVVALLAVLKAGGAYLPLDPAHPAARRAALLADAGAGLLVATPELAAGLDRTGTVLPPPVDGGAAARAPESGVRPDNAAYVLFTSGSTGRPKGVTVTHRNLVNYVHWAAGAYGAAAGGSPLHTSVAFDLTVTALFPALVSGAPVTLAPAEDVPGVEGLSTVLTAAEAPYGLVKLTPSHLRLLGSALPPAAVRGGTARLVAGGELLTGEMVDAWRTHAPDTLLFNEYGPTETTVGCATVHWRAADVEPGPLPLGVPIANTSMYVLDPDLRPVLPGAVGELHVGGVQVARGYHGRPDLTADRFGPDPFGPPGARLYRTGDLVRHAADGRIHFVSRVDTQVKVGGIRIEPAEVEAALTAHPAVAEAVVVARDGADGARLVAYVVPAAGAGPDPDALRTHLAGLLPRQLVPSLIATLDALPQTSNGKVDRDALPAPEDHRLGGGAAVPPRTDTERLVAAEWERLLGPVGFGVRDSFFAVGGTSLAAIRLAARLREVSGVHLPPARVFTADTVERLAAVLDAARTATAPAPVRPVDHDGPLPLSYAQRRLWFLDRLAPGGTDYLVPVTLRLRGPLDEAEVAAALTRVVARHAVLRTRYVEGDGGPVQLLDPPAPVPLTRVDLTGRPGADPLDVVRADLAVPVDLARDQPLRATLVRVAADEHLLLVTVHHIAFDGVSADLLLAELAGDRTPLPVQYADFAAWERTAGDPAGAVAYWRDRLAGLAPLELPTDRRRPPVRDPRGDRLAVELPPAAGAAVDRLARRHGATPFMVLLAAFDAVLARHCGQHDIAVGTPTTGRLRPETERLIGFFANTLVLRTDLSGAPTFDELVTRVRETVRDAYAHEELPFERVVEELAPERDPARNPLFQVLFEVREPAPAAVPLAGATAEPVGVAWPVAKFDLTLTVQHRADGALRCGFEYATALFDRDAVARLAEHFRRLLTAALADPAAPVHRIDVLSAAERRELTVGRTDTTVARPAAALPDLVAGQAARTPGAPAVVFGDRMVTYAELADRTARLGHHLRAVGVRAEVPVAVCLDRDADLVTALLAVQAAGGVYVPLDPAHPAARNSAVLADSGAAVLVTRRSVAGPAVPAGVAVVRLDEDRDAIAARPAAPLPAVDPGQAAYVIYTSGSTGRPKGVVVGHEAIRNRVLWTVREHGLGPGDRVLQKTTVAFDAAMWEFLAPLVAGATVVVAPDGVPRDPAAMVAAVRTHGVTVLQVVPSVLRALVEQPGLAACRTLRLVLSAGEALPVALADRLVALLPAVLVNTYGPTECAIDVTAWRHQPGDGGDVVPIGHPIDNTRVLVLDRDGELVPVGVPGELCVAGVNLARGYAGRGDLTADRFVPDPYPVTPGERLYRTGDRVRRRADGRLDYLGRLDRQVKVRGVRVEPAETEAVLAEHPAVAAAVVDARPAPGGGQRLVGYVVATSGAGVDVAALRDHLAARLPAALVPSVLHVLDALPSTASGKVDRAALAALDRVDGERAAPYEAPRGTVEAGVAAVFAEVLGVERVGRHDGFFDLGGHSLLATRLVFRLRAAFGVDVPVAEVFATPTVAGLARTVAAGGRDEDAGAVVPVPRDGEVPTSSAQRRVWFLEQLEPGSAEYLVPLVLRLRGPLAADALRRAVDDLVARHEVLRTRYVAVDGVPVQVVDPPRPVAPPVLDLSGAPPAEAARRAHQLLAAESARPFALDTDWPLRCLLVRTAPAEHLLALTTHHIATDAWSGDLLARDLGALYARHARGTAPPAPPPVQYADHAAWQERRADGPGAAADLAYWRSRLADLTPVELPTDRPRAAVRDATGDLLPVEIPAELAAAVHALARRHGVTPFVVLLSAFLVLVSRHTGRTDVAVGAPVAGRTRPEVEDVVGLFANTVVLRADLGRARTFAELLAAVRDDTVAAYAHQDLPFDRVVDALRPERDLGRNPLFQLMFEVRHGAVEPPRLAGLTVERVPSPWRTAKLDLTLSLGVHADGTVGGLIEYATALFDEATVRRLAGHYVRLLTAATDRPGAPLRDLAMLTDGERRRLLATAGAPGPAAGPVAEPALTVPELFARRVAAHPDAVAVTSAAGSLTYAELDARVNRLARHLRGLGVTAETVVAVLLERGPDAVVALLAVLRAGGAYLPLDPDHPADRLGFMLRDAGARVAVTDHRTAGRLAGTGVRVVDLDADRAAVAAQPADAPAGPPPDPDSLAYLIYTSGSTGRPKAVLIQHRSYAHHCGVIAEAYDITPGSRVVLLSALTFDVAMDQIAATLLAGATVVVAAALFWSPAELPDRIAEHGITHMEITPAYFREVMHHVRPGDPRLRGLRLMNVGSDVVTVDDARAWATTGLPGRFLCNYGPTEATVTCLLHPYGPRPGDRGEAALPIGRPVPGTTAYVLDGDGELVPVGVAGELHLGGVRLARGYHGRPALTADRFVPDPWGGAPGGRLYRTGDLVRLRADGTVEFLGRGDQQVKLRGFRIELGEVEAVLGRHPALRAVAVAARELRPGDLRLVAYVVPHAAAPDLAALRAYAAERLPDYMVPSVWMPLAELPLTPSAKVDRKALPVPEVDRGGLDRPYEPPLDPTEEIVAELWAELLGVDRVGRHDDVFLLGAHSLLVTRALARLSAVFGVDLPLRRLFEATTVAALAGIVRAEVEAEIDRLSDDEVAALLAREDAP